MSINTKKQIQTSKIIIESKRWKTVSSLLLYMSHVRSVKFNSFNNLFYRDKSNNTITNHHRTSSLFFITV